jgi:hypothetical protein
MNNRQKLENIEILLQRLEAAVVVRDPGNAHSADAYDGLRKQIIQSGKNHRTHLAHLISLSDSLQRGADIALITDRVNDFLTELGVMRISDTNFVDLFEVVEGEGSALECIEPAVVEKLDNQVMVPIKLGKARRVPGPELLEETSQEVVPTQIEQPEELRGRTSPPIRNIFFAVALVVAGLLVGLLIGGGGHSEIDDSPTTTVVNTTAESSAPSTTSASKPTSTLASPAIESTTSTAPGSTTTEGK